jgi:hypothetical protein
MLVGVADAPGGQVAGLEDVVHLCQQLRPSAAVPTSGMFLAIGNSQA